MLITVIQTRPENVRKLLDLDLSAAGGKHLKEIMKGMGISAVGIFEKSDLRKHLVQSVPELRMHLQSRYIESCMLLYFSLTHLICQVGEFEKR